MSIFFLKKFLEDMSPFCGATDTPILDLWWCLLWVSKPEWVLPYSSLADTYMLHYTFPEIHLWCDTCQPLGSQHGSQTISSTYLQGIGGTQNQELSCCCSQCEIRQVRHSTDWAIPARPAFVWVWVNNILQIIAGFSLGTTWCIINDVWYLWANKEL